MLCVIPFYAVFIVKDCGGNFKMDLVKLIIDAGFFGIPFKALSPLVK